MNFVQQSFLRMKALARESDSSNKELFDVITKEGLKKDFGIVDENAATLELGEQYEIQSYIQKIQSTIQNLIEAYTNGNLDVNNSKDLLSKYNDLALYLTTKVKYGSLSVREQNKINSEIENIIPLVLELKYLAERIDISYAPVYNQIYENLKLFKYTPITFSKATKDVLLSKTKKAYDISEAEKLVEEWTNGVTFINNSVGSIDSSISEEDIDSASSNYKLLDFMKFRTKKAWDWKLEEYEERVNELASRIEDYYYKSDVREKKLLADDIINEIPFMTHILKILDTLIKEMKAVLLNRKRLTKQRDDAFMDFRKGSEIVANERRAEEAETARIAAHEKKVRERKLAKEKRDAEEQKHNRRSMEEEDARSASVAENEKRLLEQKRVDMAIIINKNLSYLLTRKKTKELARRQKAIDDIKDEIETKFERRINVIAEISTIEKKWDLIPKSVKTGKPDLRKRKLPDVENFNRLQAELEKLKSIHDILQKSYMRVMNESVAASLPEDDDEGVVDAPSKPTIKSMTDTSGITLENTSRILDAIKNKAAASNPDVEGKGKLIKRKQSPKQLQRQKLISNYMKKHKCSFKEALIKLKK